MASNRRHWHCWLKRRKQAMFMASVPLTKREIANDLPEGSKRKVRRWFTTRQAARNRGLREGVDFVILECTDPDCPDAPTL